jgi:hypothetical protein
LPECEWVAGSAASQLACKCLVEDEPPTIIILMISDDEDAPVKKGLAELAKHTMFVKILGSYRQIAPPRNFGPHSRAL